MQNEQTPYEKDSEKAVLLRFKRQFPDSNAFFFIWPINNSA
jgi:hypothetical protein